MNNKQMKGLILSKVYEFFLFFFLFFGINWILLKIKTMENFHSKWLYNKAHDPWVDYESNIVAQIY